MVKKNSSTDKYSKSTLSTTEPKNINIPYSYGIGFIASFIVIVLLITVIVINIMALQWIYKLEEISCKCSEDWKRDYIKYYLIVYFVIITINFLLLLLNGNNINSYIVGFTFIFSIFTFINTVMSVIYINQLKEIKCNCSEDIRREIYYYYNIINIALFAISFILNIILVIVMYFFLRRL